jgi:hypothetical protein
MQRDSLGLSNGLSSTGVDVLELGRKAPYFADEVNRASDPAEMRRLTLGGGVARRRNRPQGRRRPRVATALSKPRPSAPSSHHPEREKRLTISHHIVNAFRSREVQTWPGSNAGHDPLTQVHDPRITESLQACNKKLKSF